MRNLKVLFSISLLALCGSSAALAQTASASPSETAVAATSNTATAKEDGYRVGFQDILDVQVFKHGELSQRVPVKPNGTIELFRLDQPIVAVCKTEGQLATEIAAAYKEKFIRDPQVRVVVADQRSQSVAVMGAVEKPGNFFFNRRMHLLEMLAQAGGPSKEAGTRIILLRAGSTSNCRDTTEIPDVSVMGFKLRDVQQGKQIVWMQPGDIVTVQDADIVYLYGNVNHQGPVKIKETITLTQAIVSAEGLKPAAKKGNIRILRQKPNGVDREELVFDLNEIDKGKVKDPILQPDDIVAVSQDTTKAILFGIGEAAKASIPSAIYRIP